MKGLLAMYNKKSMKAQEFISDEEILSSIEYAEKNKDNLNLINEILNKARPVYSNGKVHCTGLDHREAAVLLLCENEDIQNEIFKIAEEIKLAFYGNRIVIFAPLYLSNYCVNGCVYCPYHSQNCHIPRKKLTQEEIRNEVIALQDMGHKRLAIESGEDPVNNPIEYILESIKTIYSVHHKNGSIRRVNVNIAATTEENYKKLKDAGIGTYILFQETYNEKAYTSLHPTGPKHNYAYHTEAMDRAMNAGIDDVGLGVLFGLERYKYEFVGLLMHAEHLEAVHGVGPHTISVPRIKRADDIDPDSFSNGISDDIFAKICALIRISVPYTGIIISTRESQEVREKVLKLGVSQISGGSRTSVGGYTEKVAPSDTEQFDVSDSRTLDEVVNWLMKSGYIPSFCTACYREGRTGDRFMSLCKTGQIQNCCHPNALITLKEYLTDYALEDTRKIGNMLINKELENIPKEKVKKICSDYIEKIENGSRDFRF
jgi:2-iminoacetate synthase